MEYFWLIGFLLIVCAVGLCWLWLVLGIFKAGWRRPVGAMAIQLSLAVAVFGLLSAGGWAAVIGLIWPVPTALVMLSRLATFQPLLATFQPFFSAFAFYPITAGIAVFATLALMRPFRLWAPICAFLTGLAVTLPLAEVHSAAQMCNRALEHRITSFPRNSFYWSLRNSPREYQFDLHAYIEIDGTPFGWSYRTQDWYVIPTHANFEPPVQLHQC